MPDDNHAIIPAAPGTRLITCVFADEDILSEAPILAWCLGDKSSLPITFSGICDYWRDDPYVLRAVRTPDGKLTGIGRCESHQFRNLNEFKDHARAGAATYLRKLEAVL